MSDKKDQKYFQGNSHNNKRKHSDIKIANRFVKSKKDFSNKSLPIFSYEKQILDAVRSHRTTVVVGETGSGKSTQLPQILVDHGIIPKGKCVVCTQPRRVAAVTIAQKVASERSVQVGREVGYSIRFEDKSNPNVTQIKYVTDGVLLRECMTNPSLDNYSVIILDEAHERSLQTDILMGLLKQMQQRRSDLKLIVMSATLQVELFTSFFEDTCSVIVPGRQFPVSIYYTLEPEPDYIDAALLTCLQIHEEEEAGGVLVFLPGQEDIENLQQLLYEQLPTIRSTHPSLEASSSSSSSSSSAAVGEDADTTNVQEVTSILEKKHDGTVEVTLEEVRNFAIRPLYAAMPPDEQLRVFEPVPAGVRKFILATNIAETSVTISGVKYVVDLGLVKTRLINASTGGEMLKILPVSKSQANQRAGRAGRECAGKCFRLFTEDTFEDLQVSTIPEIQRMNIAQVLLQLKVLGIQSPRDFPFLSPPSDIVLRNALLSLLSLGALDKTQALTTHGEKMASLPLAPNFAHLLLKSVECQCVAEALTAVSVLSSENIFLQPHREQEKLHATQCHKHFLIKEGDLPTLIHIYDLWCKAKKDKTWTKKNYLSYRALQLACNIREQLGHLLTKLGINIQVTSWPDHKENFLRCLLLGLSLNVAQKVESMDYQATSKSQGAAGSQGGMMTKTVNGKTYTFSAGNASSSQAFGRKGLVVAGNGKEETAPYRTLRGHQPVHIHPSSVLFSMVNSKKLPAFVVYADLLTTSKQYMRNVTMIEGDWLPELFPQNYSKIETAPTTTTSSAALMRR